MKCQRCGFLMNPPGTLYAGMRCTCWDRAGGEQFLPPRKATEPARQLTEEDVRRIVREELAKKAPT